MPLKLLEIERELSGPASEAAFRRHDAVLAALDARISALLSTGTTPDEYAKVERLKEANVIARKLLRLAVKEGGSAPDDTTGIYNPKERKEP